MIGFFLLLVSSHEGKNTKNNDQNDIHNQVIFHDHLPFPFIINCHKNKYEISSYTDNCKKKIGLWSKDISNDQAAQDNHCSFSAYVRYS